MAIFIKPFPRPCKRCDKIYQPTGRNTLYCDVCKIPRGNYPPRVIAK